MGTIQARKTKKGETMYRALVRLKGYPIQSETFARKTDAKKWIQDTESAIRNNRHFKTAESKKHTVAEMIERYEDKILPSRVTAKKQGRPSQLERWKKDLGCFLLSDISSDDIAQVRNVLLLETTRKGTLRSPGTVNRYLAALSDVFTVAKKEWRWLESNPLSDVDKCKEPRGRVRFLSEDESTRLLDACKKSRKKLLYPIVVLALSAGPRQGNILKLKWRDIDFVRERIILEDTKNNERQSIPLVGLAKALLADLERGRAPDVDLVFPAEKDPTKPESIRKAWEAAVTEAQLDDFRFHDLRHTAASWLAMNGASLLEIADILGHKTLEMVKRYSHLTENHTTAIVARMNEIAFGK
jgi:integrase